jgi:hypothetical protein
VVNGDDPLHRPPHPGATQSHLFCLPGGGLRSATALRGPAAIAEPGQPGLVATQITVNADLNDRFRRGAMRNANAARSVTYCWAAGQRWAEARGGVRQPAAAGLEGP